MTAKRPLSILQYLLLLLFFLSSLLYISCSNDDNTQNITPDPQQPQQENKQGQIEQVLFTQQITFPQAVEHLFDGMGISETQAAFYRISLLGYNMLTVSYTAYAISYHTLAPNGEPVVASGVVYVPNIKNPKGVVELLPFNKSKSECATHEPMAPEVLPCMVGYICTLPDLIGCGTTDEMPIAYMQHDNAAIVAADLRKAAAQLLAEQYKYKMPNESIIFGYSLGGSCSWALARYYHQHPELNVRVTQIFSGGGAYYPEVALQSFLASHYSEYAVVPNILYSMNYHDRLNLDFTSIFKGTLLDNYEQWCTGEMQVGRLTTLLGHNMDDYLDFSFFTNSNPDYLRLMNTVRSKNIPNDWVPNVKVHLYHSKNDQYVPTACGDALYNYLQLSGADVTYKRLDEDHVMAILPIELDFIKYLI